MKRKVALESGLVPDERLLLQQTNSTSLMDELHEWMEEQLAEHKTEPNSGLGKAISYLQRHWTKRCSLYDRVF
jgi:transposase